MTFSFRILYGSEYGKNGTEITSLSELENFPDNYNPFKINDKYFSVFKLTFENKGSEIEKLQQNDFQIISGEEQLFPLKTEYFEENLKNDPDKVRNAYRMNMPLELTLPPSQKITKYLAVPTINPFNRELQVQYIKDKSIMSFKYEVAVKSMVKSFNVESFDFRSEYHDATELDYYFVVSYSQGFSLPLESNSMYVSHERRESPVTVYGIAIGKYSPKVFFGKRENFKFSQIPKNLVAIKFYEP